MTTPTRTNYPELLSELADKVADVLVDCQVVEAEAERIGFAAAEWLRRNHAGAIYYAHKVNEAAERERTKQRALFADVEPPSAGDGELEWLKGLVTEIAQELRLLGMDGKSLHASTRRLRDELRQYWDGERIYIPMGLQYERERRNLEIYRRFHGWNRFQLCQQFRLSEQALYRIVKKMQRKIAEEKQGKLFRGSNDAA